MLRELSIENLAVIEKASAGFGGSLNVFTGETGAGKSILIGGINAILGHRTTKEIVRTGAKKAVITALFDELPSHVSEKLRELGFDFNNEDELLLTREIFADGKSNARINGRPATAAMLKEIGSLLVDVHGQHENRILMSNDNQRDILDNYGEITEKLAPYREKFREFAKVSKRLKTLQEELKTRELKIEHLSAVVEELSALGLEKRDGESLEQELERVRSTAKIQTAVWTAYNALNSENGEGSVSALLEKALETLRSAEYAEPKIRSLADRIAALIPEADDIAGELFSLTADDYEEREAAISDKVSAIKHAKRKYNRDADELVDYLEESRAELAKLSNADDEIEKLTEQRRELAEEVRVLADEISTLRKNAAQKLSDEICEQLKFLDMPNVRILFAIEPDKITINGRDSVEMLISANAGEEPRPLTKIASGGELSRIMLAIKSVLADNDDIPTLIFDEVDAGISGRAAQKVGVKLRETAEKRQVLCITHLAQIAAKAELHLLIEKETDGGRTFTKITELDQEGRVRELARIIDGTESESAIAAAKEMLLNN